MRCNNRSKHSSASLPLALTVQKHRSAWSMIGWHEHIKTLRWRTKASISTIQTVGAIWLCDWLVRCGDDDWLIDAKSDWLVRCAVLLLAHCDQYASFFSEASLPAAPEVHVTRPVKRSVFSEAFLGEHCLLFLDFTTLTLFWVFDVPTFWIRLIEVVAFLRGRRRRPSTVYKFC